MQAPQQNSSRQLSSVPKTHRDDTLSAIRQKNHDLGAKIERLRVDNKRMKDMIANAPGTGQSRLDWLAQQLNSGF
jgi:hypothetical protein